MDYIITRNKEFFSNIGEFNYCDLDHLSAIPNTIGFDTETTSLFPRLGYVFSIQIGTGQDNYIIDLQQHNNGKIITFEEVIPYLVDKKLVGHNLTFDLGWCYKYGFYPNKTRDTFLASKILYNGQTGIHRHDFGSVMERELNLVYDKTEQKNIHKTQLSNAKAIQYAFNDVDRILDLEAKMEGKLIANGSIDTYNLHCDYIQALAYMEQCGLPLNYDAWEKKCEEDLIIQEEKKNKVIEYIYDNIPIYRDNQLDMFSSFNKNITISVTSPKQMVGVFTKLGINCQDSDGKDSIDKSIISKSDHDFVKIWLDYVDINHDVTTYGYNILDKIEDNRIYTTFNPILDTARISTRKEGINILNFPANKKTRECVKSTTGYKLIVCDFEGQENACGADLHQDETMVKSLSEGLDLHCAFARLIFPEIAHLTDAEIMRDHKDKRNYSKSPRFLFSYGGNAYSLYTNNGISMDESNKLEKLYKELHAGIYSWGEEVFKKASLTGYIESADGFKLYLPYYEEFKSIRDWFQTIEKDKEFWNKYRTGKECFENKDKSIEAFKFIRFYQENRPKISQYFKNKSKYFKLCLNNPVQTTAAHQTKKAAVMLFNYIKDNNHIGLAKIVNIPHDEFVLEVADHLVEEYKKILEYCMIEGGNHYLKSGVVKSMKAEANAGDSWYEAK